MLCQTNHQPFATLEFVTQYNWGIEAMFSDFKSRGFGLEDSQLQRTDRMDRLILVMTLALYWAVSTGMWASRNAALLAEKERPTLLRRRWLAA